MKIKKSVNDKVISFDFWLDITKSRLLTCLCSEYQIQELFIDIYNVKNNETSIFQKLMQMGFNVVCIPYKKGHQDVAIKMNASELSVLFSALSEYVFEELTVWSTDERWEQYLFQKSANQKICKETDNDLYLCYNQSETRVELYLNPNYDAEKVNSIIKKHIV